MLISKDIATQLGIVLPENSRKRGKRRYKAKTMPHWQIKAVRLRFLKEGRNRCVWCGKKLTNETLTIDHILPIGRDGKNWGSNLVPACGYCNSHGRTYYSSIINSLFKRLQDRSHKTSDDTFRQRENTAIAKLDGAFIDVSALKDYRQVRKDSNQAAAGT
jgi:hypothetical protein